MGNGDDTGGDQELTSSGSSSGNRSKNKRKYLSESQSDKSNMLSVTEFPRYEVVEEKLQNCSDEFGQAPQSDTEEQEIDEWTDPVVCEVKVFLSENLKKTFERAILKLVELGYSKDTAEQTLLRCGLYHSTKDIASNAVEGALIFMNKEKELETSRCNIFPNFDKLVDYTIIEMVSVLQKVKPGTSVAEALWILLICDMNLLHACLVNDNRPGSISLQDVFEEASRGMLPSKLKPDAFEPFRAFLKNVQFSKSITLSSQSSNYEDLTVGTPTQWSNSKGCPRGAFKTRFPWSRIGVDKPLKLPSSSSGIPLGSKGSVSGLPSVHAKTPLSPTLESEPMSKTSGDSRDSSEKCDDSAGMPSDEKDKYIQTLYCHLIALKNEIKGWNDWAMEKVQQATLRLSKDQGEIKMLKQEKLEAERLKNDKQGPEDSSLKRISEIENAINNTTDQLVNINSTISSLEKGNSELQIKLKAAKERASEATANLKEALLMEQETLKRSQAIDKEKTFLKEELTALKQLVEDMGRQLGRAEEHKTQLEVVWNREEKEKLGYLAQAEDTRRRTEQQKAKSKVEEDYMRQTAASKCQSYDQYIKKLTDEISQCRLSLDQRKIAELLGDFDVNYGGRSPGSKMVSAQGATLSKDNCGGESIKRERECVMCWEEEMSVLFLPCAHQVLCEGCNVLHEKGGKEECPSCRTPIQERIYVRFEGD